MHNEVYADALSEITVTGPIVRLDLVSMAPAAPGGEKGAPAFRQRIVMPVAGFADAVELMRKALDGLIESGAVTPFGSEPPARAVPAPGENRSPNFAGSPLP